MSKPYDAAGKELLQSDPVGWAAFLGVVRTPDKIELKDSELSTITAASDKVLLIKDEPHWLMNIEFLSWSDSGAPRQLLMYSGILQEKYRLAVASVLVLLAPKADSSAFTGSWKVEPPFGPSWDFQYTVVRLWELPVGSFLNGPLSLLPLAPMANVAEVDLPSVAGKLKERLAAEADLVERDKILTMISVLMKLRYNAMITDRFIESIPDLDDYPGFKSRLERGRVEGRVEEAREILLRMGRKKFGLPAPEQSISIAQADLSHLEALTDKFLDVKSWEELLASD